MELGCWSLDVSSEGGRWNLKFSLNFFLASRDALVKSIRMTTVLGQIEAITFDVGGTLIEPWPSVGHVYAEVAARHGLKNLSPEKLNRQFAAAWGALKNFHHTRDEWAALVDQTFAGLCERPPSGTFFPELYARFAE